MASRQRRIPMPNDQIIEGAATRTLDFQVLSPEDAIEIQERYAAIHKLFEEKLALEQSLEKRLRELFGSKVRKNESIAFCKQDRGGKYAVLYRYEVYADKET